MTRTQQSNDEPTGPEDRIAALLPMYLSGRLDEEDRAEVERWLEASPDADRALAEAWAERAAVTAANEDIVPPSGALARLNAAIDGLPQKPRPATLLSRAWGSVSSLFDVGDRRLAWGAAAALLLVVAVQAGYLASRPQPGGYQTASGGKQSTAARAADATVVFRPDARMSEISALLTANGAHIVSGPLGGVGFGIAFDETHPGGTKAERIAKVRGNNSLVVLFTPMQR